MSKKNKFTRILSQAEKDRAKLMSRMLDLSDACERALEIPAGTLRPIPTPVEHLVFGRIVDGVLHTHIKMLQSLLATAAEDIMNMDLGATLADEMHKRKDHD